MITNIREGTELFFRDLPNGSVALDMHQAFLVGLRRENLPEYLDWQHTWTEWRLWLGPFCLSLTFYR